MFFGNPSYQTIQWIKNHSDTNKSIPLCFTAVTDGVDIQLQCIGSTLKTQIYQTSTDRLNWTDHSFDSNGWLVMTETPEKSTKFILANAGDKIYFRAKEDNTGKKRYVDNYIIFRSTQTSKRLNVSGNAMSLLSPEFSQLDSAPDYCFYRLFEGCKVI